MQAHLDFTLLFTLDVSMRAAALGSCATAYKYRKLI